MSPAPARHGLHAVRQPGGGVRAGAQNPQTYQLIFNESVRGLTVGRRSIPRHPGRRGLGRARANRSAELRVFGAGDDPARSAAAWGEGVDAWRGWTGHDAAAADRLMVAHGVRAQLRTGNLLTGAVYVSLDFFPGAAPATVDWTQTPPRLPTVRGNWRRPRRRSRTSSRSSTRCRWCRSATTCRRRWPNWT